MERSAVKRIEDLLFFVFYIPFLLYNVRWEVTYLHEIFWLHQYDHVFDLVVFLSVTALIGFAWGVIIWSLVTYRTFPWFFQNLKGYSVFLFWRILTDIMMWITARLMVVAGWMSEHAYPGRGMRLTFEFDDEEDFHSAMRSAKANGLPLTDGRVIRPEEYDVPLSQHDLLEGVHYARPTYDEDILDTSLTFPSFAAIHVVDADPTDC